MKFVELICGECGKSFSKPKNEYDRQVKKSGRDKFYCGLTCSAINSNKVSPRKGNPENWKDKSYRRSKTCLSPFKWYMRRAINRSSKKGSTDLTVEYIKQLWESQDGICPVTGWKLRLPSGTEGWSATEPFASHSASLDRVDNSIGYLKGNVRFVAVMANYARNTFSDEEVIKFANAVTYHNKPI